MLAGQSPGDIPELLAYMVTITRVSQDYAGLAWVRYDAAFRRQAAITGNTKWSQINPSLYSICFTGCAQSIKCCELCLSSAHATKQCILAAAPDPDLPVRMKAVESALVSLATVRQSGSKPKRPPSTEICRLFNNKRFAQCRYRHVCSNCGEAHPALACPRTTMGPGPISPSMTKASTPKDSARPY